ncbi:DMT family transporter [Candidatus Woesearchaeota archaeon]|nr:DMT family transporter [Candidatus Woesearchaeota archaeon]
MLWIILSVLSGLGDAIIFALMKKLKGVNSSIVVWVHYAFAIPFLLVFLYFSFPENISNNLYWIIPLNSILLLISSYMLLEALQASKISVSLPMLSLTPLFLVLLSYIILKEIPSAWGFVGILLIVVGAYIINIKNGKGFFEPFAALFKIKGSLYVIVVSFIWSITATLYKKGIIESNPVYFTSMTYLFTSAIMLPFLFFNFRGKLTELRQNIKMLLFLGAASAFMTLLSSYAMLFTLASYVISIKRSSLIFSIFIGYFYFKEKNIKNALIGTVIMLIGGVLITLF